ncbi:acyltransferase [Gramella sp. BOM4]|nr:acyltransferase [Christiangramia bathymodioli]
MVIISHVPIFIIGSKGQLHKDLSLDGVSMFFVLSGFLIGRILIKTFRKEVSFGKLYRFWAKRWLRTVPLYLILLSTFVFITYFNSDPIPLNIQEYFIFLQNFSEPHPDFFGVAWSLSVEEWFYLIVPYLLFIALSVNFNPKRNLLYISILLIIIPLLYRSFLCLTLEPEYWENWGSTCTVLFRFDSIMYGILGAWVSNYYPKTFLRFNRVLLILGIILLIGFKALWVNQIISKSSVVWIYLPVVNSVGVLFMLPFLSTYKTQKGWIAQAITHTSVISYSMYLLHAGFVIELILKKISWSDQLYPYVLYFIITYVLSFLSYQLIEKKFLKLRRLIFKEREYKVIRSID